MRQMLAKKNHFWNWFSFLQYGSQPAFALIRCVALHLLDAFLN